MSQFGGSFQFGTGRYGGDPFGLKAGYVIGRIMSELSRFKKVTVSGNTTGVVQTIDLLTGPVDDAALIDLMVRPGLPAFLVGHTQSDYESNATDNLSFSDDARFAIVCVAEHLLSRNRRLDGRSVYHPGLFQLAQWALVYGLRAIRDLQSRYTFRPLRKRFIRYASERFAAVIEFSCEFAVDAQDDIGTFDAKLESLGIVHNPVDLNALFLPDNLTPDGDYHSVYIGVADVSEDE